MEGSEGKRNGVRLRRKELGREEGSEHTCLPIIYCSAVVFLYTITWCFYTLKHGVYQLFIVGTELVCSQVTEQSWEEPFRILHHKNSLDWLY